MRANLCAQSVGSGRSGVDAANAVVLCETETRRDTGDPDILKFLAEQANRRLKHWSGPKALFSRHNCSHITTWPPKNSTPTSTRASATKYGSAHSLVLWTTFFCACIVRLMVDGHLTHCPRVTGLTFPFTFGGILYYYPGLAGASRAMQHGAVARIFCR